MINMFDTNQTGTIDMNEFGRLFAYIQQWKAMFENFDRDRTGTIDQGEFSQALQQMGYRFSPQFTQNVLSKLDPRTRKLTLDNFIVVSIQVKRLTDSFRTRDKEMKGQAPCSAMRTLLDSPLGLIVNLLGNGDLFGHVGL